MRVEPGPPGLFPFKLAGTDVLSLGPAGDLSDDPLQWPTPSISRLPFTSANVTLGNAVGLSTADGHVYILGGFSGDARAAFMARIPMGALLVGEWGTLTAWTTRGEWESLESDPPLQQLFDFVPSESTLTYHPSLKLWVILRVNTFLGNNVTLLSATLPEGPYFSQDIYAIPPEQLAGDAFCYAGKVHPELSDSALAAELVFTYMCNTPSLSGLRDRADVYIPQLVRVTFS